MISTKLPNPIRETHVPNLVFITIPCLRFSAQGCTQHNKSRPRTASATNITQKIEYHKTTNNRQKTIKIVNLRAMPSIIPKGVW